MKGNHIVRTRFLHVRDLLRHHEAVRASLEQEHVQQEIVTLVRAALPESVSAHCLDIGVTGTVVTVFLDSPAWSTRARFLAAQIVSSLSAHGIDEARFKVRQRIMSRPTQSNATQTMRGLSEEVVSHLHEAADQQSDPSLSAAFRRLASRHARRTSADED